MTRTAVSLVSQESELQEFLDLVRPKLRRLLISSRVPLEDAEDVAQDALVVLLRRWHRGMDDVESREAWMLGTMRRIIFLYWRRRLTERRLLARFALELSSTESVPQEQEDTARDVEALTAPLKPRDRHLLWLRYALELKPRESADALGCEPGSVLRLSRRALDRARSRLGLPPLADLRPAVETANPSPDPRRQP